MVGNYAGYQVVLPWERHKVNQDHEKDWMSGGAMGDKKMKHDHEYKKVGVDLDGVLCKDLAEEKYEVNLEECLNERDELKKEDNAPALNKEVHVIITARPLEDEERTRKWLNRVGYHDIEMYLRKTNHKSWKDSAHHKGQTAMELGCSVFIESCAKQATWLACYYPHLEVYWWNEGDPVLIRANPSSL